MRQLVSTALVACIVSALTVTVAGALAQEPVPAPQEDEAVVTAGLDADSVDGRHAVKATSKKTQRRNKLVAADAKGYLPNNIVKPKWGLISGKPAAFADGVITWDEVANKPALGGGPVAWADIQNMPAGFADGSDDGITRTKLTRVTKELLIHPGTKDAAIARCPSDSGVTGGGWMLGQEEDMYIHDSHPDGPNGWLVTASNSGVEPWKVFAFAICLSVEPPGAITTASRRRR